MVSDPTASWSASQKFFGDVCRVVPDLGANDVGWSDPTVISPTIDSLAYGGVRLTHLYAYHWCAPSRASFFSGRYIPMHGYESGGDGPDGNTGTANALPLRYNLVPQALSDAGYQTLMVGK
jgi:arylsulfatase A-like enzyme